MTFFFATKKKQNKQTEKSSRNLPSLHLIKSITPKRIIHSIPNESPCFSSSSSFSLFTNLGHLFRVIDWLALFSTKKKEKEKKKRRDEKFPMNGQTNLSLQLRWVVGLINWRQKTCWGWKGWRDWMRTREKKRGRSWLIDWFFFFFWLDWKW